MSNAPTPRTKRSPEWLAKRREIRGYDTPEIRRAKALARYHKKRTAYLATLPPEPKYERQNAMKKDPRTDCWMVGVPPKDGEGKVNWITTGEKEIGDALKVVDASGVQRLSILARAKCLTADAASIILAGKVVTCKTSATQWAHDIGFDLAKKTVWAYVGSINKLIRDTGNANNPVSSLTRDQLYNFVNEPSLKEGSRKIRLAAISSFYRYAAGYGHVIGNLAETIRVNKSLLTVEQREQIPATPFTEDEYRRIMANHDVPQFWRWASALGWWLGLRMVDVCRYEWASIGDDFAVLYPQKTGRRLVLPLHDPLIGSGELRSVFDEMRLAISPKETHCFTKAKKFYETDRMSKYEGGFKAALALCGITDKSFHGWRHSFKIRLYQSGKTMEEIRDLMGHASVHTTEGYGRMSA